LQASSIVGLSGQLQDLSSNSLTANYGVFTTLSATDASGLSNVQASSIVGLSGQLQDLSSNSVTSNYGVFTKLSATDGSAIANISAANVVGLQDLSSNSVTSNYGVFTNLTHQGLVFTEGSGIDQLVRANITMTLGTEWQDLPAPPLLLTNTIYTLALVANNADTYTGLLSWYGGLCTSNATEELILHRAGTSAENSRVYARTAHRLGNTMSLQLAAATNAGGPAPYALTFRRLA
jgi:hypothetical protein